MIQKKICLLGSFSVGKTSLIKRFVESIFDEKYLTTMGVKIDKKSVEVEGEEVRLMIWDLEGEDDFSKIKTNHLRGASGYILVADGTRPDTFAAAQSIHELAQGILGQVPAILAMNKADIEDQWIVPESLMDSLDPGLKKIKTSALNGLNVEQLFSNLARELL